MTRMNLDQLNRIGETLVVAAITVHRALGPGLLESTYEVCLAEELCQQGLRVERGVTLPLVYKGKKIRSSYRLDMLINDCVIVENKAVDLILPLHEAQLLTYMKLKGCPLGYLLNWNVPLMKKGIRRLILTP